MTLCSVFRILAILAAISEVINGCGKQSSENKNLEEEINIHRKTRELDAPILVGESGFGVLLRPHNTKVDSKDIDAENLFRRIDTNANDVVDAAEWVDFSKETSVWDFVKLLDYADLDGKLEFAISSSKGCLPQTSIKKHAMLSWLSHLSVLKDQQQ
ncbi:hypothetical protein HOLleu_40434 [Holothuria leucospilota]|uniref:EF-hand domain-containing protein n=1 Tax=Holothuria leucospilota TaxID=206669 RepID=A0A9Q0YFT1_HOLLE|nr:hypothetical protein HOLleu_40434 [Holothuria leucospilota]